MTMRNIRKLNMADVVAVATDHIAHIFAHQCHVIDVVLRLHNVTHVELINNIEHLLAESDQKPRHIASIDRLKGCGDTEGDQRLRSLSQILFKGIEIKHFLVFVTATPR